MLCVCSQENVSLADILCLRDDGLTEQQLWAVCVECVCSLQSISLSPLYHTLCITPDTLAFNAHGNVCFMEQMNGESQSSNITFTHSPHVCLKPEECWKHFTSDTHYPAFTNIQLIRNHRYLPDINEIQLCVCLITRISHEKCLH